jgi:2-oxoglutarate ferredoxin oxidoreductase subunit alpha
VFIASNKEIGLTKESVNLDTLKHPALIERASPVMEEPFLPFKVSSGEDVPGFLPIGDTTLVRQTSSTHGADGYITTEPYEISAMLERMKRKIEARVERFSLSEIMIEPNAKTVVVTYGVTARAARAAYRELKAEGKPISLLILKTLWPVPEKLIRQKTEGVQRVLVVEMNQGQYAREIERLLKDNKVEILGQMDGQLISPSRIKEAANG